MAAEEIKIRKLNVNEVTTQFLVANLYSSWKLVEANNELEGLSRKLKEPGTRQEMNTLYAPMLRQTGDMYKKIDQKERAERTYTEAVELTRIPNEKEEKAAAHVSLGKLYEESGRKEKAVESFQKGKLLYEQGGNVRKAAETRRTIVKVQNQ